MPKNINNMIKEFDLGLLRSKLWVAVNTTREEINSLLSLQMREGMYGDISDDLFNDYLKDMAVTIRARNKDNYYLGYLVIILRPSESGSELVDTIAHEACHVSDFAQRDLGCEAVDTEINAHITGYVAGKIMLTYNEEKYGTENGTETNSQPTSE